jgi:L-alanine-DL-glutamate epimerase-like enolase superfamily enzyme
MNRRDWLRATGVLAAAGWPAKRAAAAEPSRSRLEAEVVRLHLKHTWTTTMSSSAFRDTLHVRLARDGVTGIGEGAPIARYDESALDGRKALLEIQPLLESADPWALVRLLGEVGRRVQGQYAARAALDIALHDWRGRKLGVPLWRLFGLDRADAPVTTFSIGIDTPEITRQKVKEAKAYPVLKIKVGLDTDEPTIEAVRSVTKKPLRVDANEGWRDKDEAVRKIRWLETQGVEFIEQPMAAALLDEQRYIRKNVHMPIFADEACLRLTDIPKIADAYDGVNVKVDKAGGLLEARRMIDAARAHGLKVMLGCMVSSSVAITAAAHLSPLVDYADLDGNLLLADDPYVGVTVVEGKLILPEGPGLGVTKRA